MHKQTKNGCRNGKEIKDTTMDSERRTHLRNSKVVVCLFWRTCIVMMLGETEAVNQRDARFISIAAAAAACRAMRSIACCRVAACWSVNCASGIGGTGGKMVGVVEEG